jgi:anti-anti-sigma factor
VPTTPSPYEGVGPPRRVTPRTCRPVDPTDTVFVAGDLDLESRDRWYDECIAAVGPDVLVDLEATTFMDCCGYSALTSARDVIEARGGTLVWRGARNEPAQMLDLVLKLQAPIAGAPIGGRGRRATPSSRSRRCLARPAR